MCYLPLCLSVLPEYVSIFHYLWTFSHETELTQWDHPEMTEILNSLCKPVLFNLKSFTAPLFFCQIN